MIIVFGLELCGELVEVVGGVCAQKLKALFLKLRVVTAHQLHRVLKAAGHGVRLLLGRRTAGAAELVFSRRVRAFAGSGSGGLLLDVVGGGLTRPRSLLLRGAAG